jgi:hypothetical protein
MDNSQSKALNKNIKGEPTLTLADQNKAHNKRLAEGGEGY